MTRAALIVVTLALPLAAIAPARAQGITPAPASPAPSGDRIVATVNGTPITADDLQAYYESLPARYQQIPIQRIYPQLVERLVDQRLLAQAARASGIDKKSEVRHRITNLVDGLLQEAYLHQQIDPQISEERLHEEYQRRIALQPKREEVHALHILVKTRAAALAIIAELKAGADFAKVAREKSTGPSARQGGDLGFFTRDQMVKPFSDAAFALKPGQFTTEPVHTQFGWHVIKVVERRMAGARPFSEMKDELRRKLSEDAYDRIVQKLRADANITTPGIGKIRPVQ